MPDRQADEESEEDEAWGATVAVRLTALRLLWQQTVTLNTDMQPDAASCM